MQGFFLYLFKCSYHKYKLNIEQQRAQNLSQQIQNTEYSTLDHRLDLLGCWWWWWWGEHTDML